MTISVIVPMYNVERYIERCLTSIFTQTWRDLQIVLIDDCSTDGTAELARQVVDRHEERKAQTILIRQPENHGSAYTRTVGMKQATGDYMIQIDSDDYLASPDYLARLAQPIVDSDMAVDMAYTGFTHDYGTRQVRRPLAATPDRADQMLLHVLDGRLHSGLPMKLLRSEIIRKYQIYPARHCNMLDDKTVIVRFLYFADRVCAVDSCDYIYNKQNEQSITANNHKQSTYEAYLRQSAAFFADKTAGPSLRTALLHERIGLYGHYLLYDARLDDRDYELLLGVDTLRHVADHPSLPWYYKAIVMARVTHMNWLVRLLRKAFRLNRA